MGSSWFVKSILYLFRKKHTRARPHVLRHVTIHCLCLHTGCKYSFFHIRSIDICLLTLDFQIIIYLLLVVNICLFTFDLQVIVCLHLVYELLVVYIRILFAYVLTAKNCMFML